LLFFTIFLYVWNQLDHGRINQKFLQKSGTLKTASMKILLNILYYRLVPKYCVVSNYLHNFRVWSFGTSICWYQVIFQKKSEYITCPFYGTKIQQWWIKKDIFIISSWKFWNFRKKKFCGKVAELYTETSNFRRFSVF